LLLAAVHLAGGARLGREPQRELVRVASFAMSSTPPVPVSALLPQRFQGAALDSLRGRLKGLQQSLVARAEQEAKAGARLVFWSEANAVVLTPDVDDFLVEGATLAHDAGIHLGMAFAALMPGEGRYENRFVILNPEGDILLDYHKARPLPGARERGSDHHLAVVETPFGKLAAVIGFDADFPALVREAGESRADVLLVPAADQESIDPLHARMAIVRAIENGCALVRPAREGRSVATDARGRVLASVDFSNGEPCVMVAQVPRHGEATIYSRIGDLLAWLCLGGLGIYLGLALRAAKPARREEEQPAPIAEAA
jgi:apolipoprotein N-acyltransferase